MVPELDGLLPEVEKTLPLQMLGSPLRVWL